jgi:hypothetical protein
MTCAIDRSDQVGVRLQNPGSVSDLQVSQRDHAVVGQAGCPWCGVVVQPDANTSQAHARTADASPRRQCMVTTLHDCLTTATSDNGHTARRHRGQAA